jgi:hypothetical protein
MIENKDYETLIELRVDELRDKVKELGLKYTSEKRKLAIENWLYSVSEKQITDELKIRELEDKIEAAIFELVGRKLL